MAGREIRFDGQAILVTGAGRGLGRAQALLLASRGAKVVVADNGTTMNGEGPGAGPAQSVVDEIQSAGGEAIACSVDIALEAGAAQAVQETLRAFGRIDGIVHYASTSPNLKSADALSTHDLDLVMRVNAFAGLWLARAAWPHMQKQRHGRLVYVTSGGIFGAVGNADYAAAKSAFIGITRCLALEGAKDGILVNAVAPAARTRMTERFPASAYADWFFATMAPEKVTPAVAFLLSRDCAVHGEIYSVGGGRIARIALAETKGIMTEPASIEAFRDQMPQIMADTDFFFPKDLAERSGTIAARLGFDGGLAANTFAVKPVDGGA